MMMMSFRPSLLVSILLWSATTANENGGVYYNTITDLVLETPELSTLADLLQLTGLDETLDDKYAYFTVFAPRDAAFERLDPDVLQSLLKDRNRDLLKDTLLYHVVSDSVFYSDELKKDERLEMANGGYTQITSLSPPMINDARIVEFDIHAANGVVHVLKDVLLQPKNEIIDDDYHPATNDDYHPAPSDAPVSAPYDSTNDIYPTAPTNNDDYFAARGTSGEMPTLEYKGNGGHPSQYFPLQQCQGDCDSDRDCSGNLRCFDEVKSTTVPGCSGHRDANGNDFVDYCYDPSGYHQAQPDDDDYQPPMTDDYHPDDNNYQPPTTDDYHPPQADDYKPPVTDEYHPMTDPPQADDYKPPATDEYQPPTTDEYHPTQAEDYKPTVTDEYQPPMTDDYHPDEQEDYGGEMLLVHVGDNGHPSESFPLGECEGDCDSDHECEGDLLCYDTSGPTTVPGCEGHRGTTSSGNAVDYCYRPQH